MALRTDSGTRCRFIDSIGGGAAGKGDGIGMARAAEREDRVGRVATGDKGANVRGGDEAAFIEARREIGLVGGDEAAEGGDDDEVEDEAREGRGRGVKLV